MTSAAEVVYSRQAARTITRCLGLIVLFGTSSFGPLLGQTLIRTANGPASATKAYGGLPLYFEQNIGQSAPQVKFLSRGAGYGLFLTPTETVIELQKAEVKATGKKQGGRTAIDEFTRSLRSKPETTVRESVVRMKFLGTKGASRLVGVDDLEGKDNYLLGNDPTKWFKNVPTFAKVQCTGVYPGIDALYYGTDGRLEYDLVVQPHADPGVIRFGIDGANKLSISKSGDLLLETELGPLTWQKPVMYQMTSTGRKQIEGNYVKRSDNEVGIEIQKYDRDKALVIDPVLLYSSYLGGTGSEQTSASFQTAAVDQQGAAYIVGTTTSSDFPASQSIGTLNTTGSPLLFVTKLDPTGTTLVYSTFIGGTGSNIANYGMPNVPGGIAVDANGYAYVVGVTLSSDFPITSSAYQSTPVSNATSMIFLAKLTSNGQSLLYSTFLGGNAANWANGISVDSSQNAYLTGWSTAVSTPFPLTANAIQTVNKSPNGDAFVAKIATTQSGSSSLVYSTLLGGSSTSFLGDMGFGVVGASNGHIFVTGETSSTDFPVTANAYQSTASLSNGGAISFLSEIDPTHAGSTGLVYSTYFGGTSTAPSYVDWAYSLALDSTGKPHIAGFTSSLSGFPVTVATANPTFTPHAFTAEFDTTKSSTASLIYSLTVGDFTVARGITLDSLGDSYICGYTANSLSNVPVTPDAVQSTTKGTTNGFLTALSPNGSAVLYGTYFGDSGAYSFADTVSLDSVNNIYIAGLTTSIDLPTTQQGYQSTLEGPTDLFVAKFSALPAFPSISTITPGTAVVGASVTVNGQNFGSSQGTSTISFHGTAATPSNWSSSSIVVPVPSGATTGNVVVTVGGIASNAVSFSVGTQSTPTITSLTPSTAGIGAPIIVVGTNFGATQGSSTLTFNGTVANPTFWSTTAIQVPVPSGATTGNVVVTVGGMASTGKSFTMPTSGPIIRALSPDFGTTGTLVTIDGAGFGSTQGSSTLKFNTTTASITSWSDTQIVAADPSGATDGNVVVTVNGIASNGIWFPEAHINSISPTSGPAGTTVTITGANFRTSTGTVFFNGLPATVSGGWSNTVTAIVPAGATTGNVVVETSSHILSNGVNFTVTGGATSPIITGLSPTSSAVGTFVTIFGGNFGSTQGNGTVTFNGTAAAAASWNPGAIVVAVPGGATTGSVFVTVGGVPSNGVPFTVSSTSTGPSVSQIYPSAVMVGQNLTLTGSGFGSTQGSGFVSLGAINGTVVSWSNTQVVVTIPTGASSGQLYLQQGGINSEPVPFTIITAPSTATEYSYDSMGRVIQTYSCAPANCGTGQGRLISYTYDYAGDMTSISSYGTTIQYGIDSAGRVTQVTSGWVDSQHPATLATVDPNNGYWPTGALRKVTLGNNLTESMVADPLGQPCRINVNSSGTLLTNCADALPSGNVQDMNASFNFGSSDNGNLAGLTAVGRQNFNRSYTYDPMNRLQTMSAPGDACSGLSWTIDPWGNRLSQTTTGGSCFSPTVAVNTNNRLVGSPYQYDAAGNLLNDGNHSYTYDAESRVTQVDGGATATYVYDASGNRVDKKVGSVDYEYVFDQAGRINTVFNNGTMQRMYVYVGGKQLAEYFANTTYFVHTDNLGSTRLVTGMDQSISESDDYYPYGESITTGTSDILKFTGKERDSESGLDEFGARYYGSSMGRFMTPDWAARPIAVPYAVFGDPQSLNLYGYVRNDPVSQADADGHGTCGPGIKMEANTQCNTGSNPGSPDNTQPAAQNQPLSSVTVLGNKVGITYDGKLSAADQLAASNAIVASAALINKNASSLTADQTKAIGQISSFAVSGPNTQLGASGKGSMTLSVSYIRNVSTAWLGSLFGHEGQHYLNSGKYSGTNLWRDEQSAGRTQLGIGNKIGFSDRERQYLEQWIDDKNRAAMQQHMEQGYSY